LKTPNKASTKKIVKQRDKVIPSLVSFLLGFGYAIRMGLHIKKPHMILDKNHKNSYMELITKED